MCGQNCCLGHFDDVSKSLFDNEVKDDSEERNDMEDLDLS